MGFSKEALHTHFGFCDVIGPEIPHGWQQFVYGGGQRSGRRKQACETITVFRCPVCLSANPCAVCIKEKGMRLPVEDDKVVYEVLPTGYEVFANRLKSAEAEQRKEESRTRELSPRAKQNIAEINHNPDRPFTCTNEAEVVFMFAEVARSIGYRIRRLHPNDYPDGLFLSDDGHLLRIEFEYLDSNFIDHGHNPNEVDLIVCWKRTERGREALTVPVIALKEHYNKKGKRWDWSTLK